MGLIFTATRDAMVNSYGEDFWDDVLHEAELDGAYTAIGNYDHQQLAALVQVAAGRLNQPPGEILRKVGRAAFPVLHEKVRLQTAGYRDSREFIKAIPAHIHKEARRIYPESRPPAFTIEESGRDLLLEYRSHRRLCHLAEGLARGALDHFRQQATVEQTECALEGADRCLIRLRYEHGPA